MSSLLHGPRSVQPTLRVVRPLAPCPSESQYLAACYFIWFRDRKRWCEACLAECDGQDLPAWVVRPEPADTLSFPDWIDSKAEAIRAEGTEAAEWLADKLEALASEARWLDASTPEDFDDRAHLVAADVAEQDRLTDQIIHPHGVC